MVFPFLPRNCGKIARVLVDIWQHKRFHVFFAIHCFLCVVFGMLGFRRDCVPFFILRANSIICSNHTLNFDVILVEYPLDVHVNGLLSELLISNPHLTILLASSRL